MIEGQAGLTWPRWKRLVAEVEALGFAGLFRSDHFTMGQNTREDALETIVSLAYLADRTQRVHFGPLVAPLTFRDPVMLARQAIALDDLSGGRMILGVGAGWQAREHTMFGYPLGDVRTRMARFQEGLEVITRLLRRDEPVSFRGQFFNLEEALLLPRPARQGGPPLLVGGNGRTRTLALAARYADIWNGLASTPEEFRALSTALDGELDKIGRNPRAVKRTLSLFMFFGADDAALARRLERARMWTTDRPELPLHELRAVVRDRQRAIVGLAADVIPQLRAYREAGVEELVLQCLDSEDIEGLRAFAEQVLPEVNAR
jgi:F420-dependent oxidoreductase-like protein